jgi:hypothetical protein
MKTISDHIQHVKGKPHHVRRRVAFSAAMTGTALVALVWLVGSLGTGSFALKETSFADSSQGTGVVVAGGDGSSAEGLAGVGAAVASDNTNAPARIEIVNVATSTSSGMKAEQTTIPF